MTLPTMKELPPAPHYREIETFLQLALIPADADDHFRKVALLHFQIEEEACGPAEDEATSEALQLRLDQARYDVAEIRALTPGGLAWKLAAVLFYFQNESPREWWLRWLDSAFVDAVELERQRREAPAEDLRR